MSDDGEEPRVRKCFRAEATNLRRKVVLLVRSEARMTTERNSLEDCSKSFFIKSDRFWNFSVRPKAVQFQSQKKTFGPSQ